MDAPGGPAGGPARTATAARGALFSVTEPRGLPGYRFGLRQHAVIATLALDLAGSGRAAADLAHRLCAPHLPETPFSAPDPARFHESDAVASVERLAALVIGVQEAAGGPVEEAPRLFVHPPSRGAKGAAAARRSGLLAIPTIWPAFGLVALRWAIGLFARIAAGEVTAASGPAVAAQIAALLPRLDEAAPIGRNARVFLRAAHRIDAPATLLPGRTVQYGIGRGARRTASTVTDRTGALGVQIAGDKRATTTLLARAGFPVPEQYPATSLEEARRAAARIGYPVVLKLPLGERGEGVAGDLANVDELDRAHGRLTRHTPPGTREKLVVERHAPGATYRVNVLGAHFDQGGKAVAQVTGDGRRTLRALTEAENALPERGPGGRYRPIPLDRELEDRLHARGMTLGTVLPAGESFALRGSANMSTGARTIFITAQDVHPETHALCRRVADFLGLDIAGIDIVTPDIGRPLAETGGVICEINAAPQIDAPAETVAAFLADALADGGRAPVALWLTDAGRAEIVPPALHPVPPEALRPALLDPETDRITLVCDGATFAAEGLPLDRLHAVAAARWDGRAESLVHALAVACEQLRGPVLAPADHPHRDALARAVRGRELRFVPDGETLAGALEEALAAAHSTRIAPRSTAST